MTDVIRLVPVDATDLASERPHTFPHPLNLLALQKLATTFSTIYNEISEECVDASTRTDEATHSACQRLADADADATTARQPDNRSDLPTVAGNATGA